MLSPHPPLSPIVASAIDAARNRPMQCPAAQPLCVLQWSPIRRRTPGPCPPRRGVVNHNRETGHRIHGRNVAHSQAGSAYQCPRLSQSVEEQPHHAQGTEFTCCLPAHCSHGANSARAECTHQSPQGLNAHAKAPSSSNTWRPKEYSPS